MFFAETQNKLLYAVTNHTAAELIMERADAGKPNMGLTSWKGSIVRKQDIFIAKNYLQESELDKLNRLVTIFLESAELRVKERRDLTMSFWRNNVDAMLTFQNQTILPDAGQISNQVMEKRVRDIYEQYDQRRREYEALEADRQDMLELQEIENSIINRK